jgi:RHS repeat-associated protein
VRSTRHRFGDRYKFQGEPYEEVIQRYLFGNKYGRYYNPAAGVFDQEDHLGLDAGDPNFRRFVGNDPTNATDPSGLQWGGQGGSPLGGGTYPTQWSPSTYGPATALFRKAIEEVARCGEEQERRRYAYYEALRTALEKPRGPSIELREWWNHPARDFVLNGGPASEIEDRWRQVKLAQYFRENPEAYWTLVGYRLLGSQEAGGGLLWNAFVIGGSPAISRGMKIPLVEAGLPPSVRGAVPVRWDSAARGWCDVATGRFIGAPGGLAQTRSLRQIRTLAEQGSLNVSQETLDMLRVLRQNGSRLEVAAADLPATLPRMAELQRAAQVEFALVQQEGRYFLIRGLPEEVAFGRNAEMLLAHTHPGPSGLMALRPSRGDIRNLPLGQDASIIIGADGRWLIFSRTGRPRILAGGQFP